MMHGPFLFHTTALVYRLLGASDVSARVLPALAGVALVMSLHAFRRYLGRAGALAAAVLATFSPSLLFYGRSLIHDVYAVWFALLWTLCAFRFRDTGRFRWLLGMTVAMALSFSVKATAFLFGPLVGLYFAGRALAEWRRGGASGAARCAALAVTMLTLALPLASSLAYFPLGWDRSDMQSPDGLRHAAVSGIGLLLLSALGAWVAFRRPSLRAVLSFRGWIRAAASFWTILVVLFSTVLTHPRGLATGIVGSLGYWLGQHPVARGSQPWFFYLALGALYEFLPGLTGVAGAAALARLRRGGLPPRAGRLDFVRFCAWWSAGSLVAYSFAGEKMPWLLMHIALPLCLLGGFWLGLLVRPIDWRRLGAAGAMAVALPSALALAAAPLFWIRPFRGRDLESLAASGRWLFHAAAATVLAVAAGRGLRRLSRPMAGRLLALGGCLLLWALTVRSTLMLTFVNADMATELLVYAHGTPDVKHALREIEEIATRTGVGADLEVAYDDDSAWPFSWYLRDYRNQRFYGDRPTAEAMSSPVVIVGTKNLAPAFSFLADGYVRRDYRLVWWPVELREILGGADLWAALSSADGRARLLQIVLHRRYPDLSLARWPYRHEFKLFLRRDVVQQVWPLGLEAVRAAAAHALPGPVAEVSCAPAAVLGGPYGGRPLREPSAVAVDGDGRRLIADTGNDRLVLVDRRGAFVRAFGSRCELAREDDSGCIDPDGPGPRRRGEGQLLEPWGVAVGRNGDLAVADTWNGRVQVFSAHGEMLWTWGELAVGWSEPVPPDRLYGPRGLAAASDGLWVADTGNQRLLLIRANGQVVAQVGGGAGDLRFREPVGLAIGPGDGHVYVADAWNRRIVRLDPTGRRVAEWPVPGWGVRDSLHKPYLAVDADGSVYASDPENARVLVFGPRGDLHQSVFAEGWRETPRARPTGLALDLRSRQLLVADPATDRVWVLPLECSDTLREGRAPAPATDERP
jgi:uncharacterized protein (TIGR03663 family)